MENIDSFDSNNIQSIKDAANKVHHMIQKDVNETFIKKNFEKAIKCLKQMNQNEYESEKTKQLLRLIGNSTARIGQYLYTEEIIKWLVSLEMHNLFKKMLNQYLNFKDNENKKYLIGRTIGAIMNVTMDDGIIALENIKYGIVEFTLKMIENENFLDRSQLKNTISIDLYDRIITFLYNNARLVIVKNDLLKLNIISELTKEKEKLNTVMNSYGKDQQDNLEMINLNIVSTLSCLLDEEQLEKQEVSSDLVNSLLNIVKKTIQQSINNDIKRNTKFYLTFRIGSSTGYTYAGELLDSLLKIAVNDRVKEIIFQLNGLESIAKVFKDDENEYYQKVCALLIASLCFNENIKKQIKSDEKLIKLIEVKMCESKIKDVNDSCKQILAMINNTIETKLANAIVNKVTAKEHQHIMISYCHVNKMNCIRLNEILKFKGYKTWIDFEHPFENLFDGMTSAIVNASIVLICYSDAYKRSSSCRLEAENAWKHKKPCIPIRMEYKYKPDGWLGFLLGVLFYTDLSNFSDINEQNSSIKSLLNRIDNILNGKFDETFNGDDDTEHQSHDNAVAYNKIDHENKERIKSAYNKKEIVKKWTSEDVNKWLDVNGLNDCISLFSGYDGKSLLGLHDLQKLNNQYFCKILDDEISNKNLFITVPIKLKLFNVIGDLT